MRHSTKRCRLFWVPLVGLCLVGGAQAVLGAQVCKYDSIPATAPAERFLDNGDGTVSDSVTGLQWKRCSEGQVWDGVTCTGTATNHTWQDALQRADEASYAEQDDWRLPNTKELSSLVERACYDPAINLTAFPNTPGNTQYWSSSPSSSENGGYRAWYVYFYAGSSSVTRKEYSVPFQVRLVRGGQTLGPLNDTGIDWWGDETTNFLPSEPPDYPGQDASRGRDATDDDDIDGHAGFRFTKLDADGNPLPASATSWSCVRDEVSGLTWEVKTDDGGLRDKDWTYTWYNSDPATNGGNPGAEDGGTCGGSACDTNGFVAAVNDEGLCGASDWRLPEPWALSSILDLGRSNPTIDITWFPHTVSERYWSSFPYGRNITYAWWVHFWSGDLSNEPKGSARYARLVRGGQASSPFALTVTTAGTGGGLVTSEAPGIDCGTQCEDSYPYGTLVTLTATADSGSRFDAWDGDCAGTQPTCEVLMSMARTVTATFATSDSTCAAETALSQRPDGGAWLGLLDQVRDELLAHTPAGRSLVDAYYRHSDEVSARLRAEPRLALRALHLLAVLRTDLQVAASGGMPTIDARETALIRAFDRQLKRGASPSLRQDLDQFLALPWSALLPETEGLLPAGTAAKPFKVQPKH